MKRISLWGVALITVLGLSSPSQAAFAQITGTVEDAAGATLSAGSDTGRGTASTTKTTQGGVFNFTNFPIGTYEVKAEPAGFDTAVQPSSALVLAAGAR
jgi:hypothetical protein